MKVAAYQAPLAATCKPQILDLIREQVTYCESHGIEILCCPEGVLGGLADYAKSPQEIAVEVESGQLRELLAPFASDNVAVIVGFTELGERGRLYNSAAVFNQGSVVGVYRKRHPAINHSIYEAGDKYPVFTIGELTFGIVICRDSSFHDPAMIMASQGAAALFVPTNNGLPPTKGGPELVTQARNVDIARAIENGVSMIRADVVGEAAGLVSYGASGIVNPDGVILQSAQQLCPQLVVADIETTPRAKRRGRNAWINNTGVV